MDMKNKLYLLLTALLVFTMGCEVRKDAAIIIDDIEITKAEFDEAFEASRFASMKKGKKAFLDSYIEKKLILKEAENMGLDKDPEFLSEIQLFWEKALLKLVLSRKSDELAALVDISDKEVLAYFKKNGAKLFAGKKLAEVSDQIEWFIIQGKQSGAMEEWTELLKGRAKIKVDYGRLGIKE